MSSLDWGGRSTSRPGSFTPGKETPVPISQEAGLSPGLVWTDEEYLFPAGIRSLDLLTRSESPCRLSYPDVFRAYNRCNGDGLVVMLIGRRTLVFSESCIFIVSCV
jgi:hypothetical protein